MAVVERCVVLVKNQVNRGRVDSHVGTYATEHPLSVFFSSAVTVRKELGPRDDHMSAAKAIEPELVLKPFPAAVNPMPLTCVDRAFSL